MTVVVDASALVAALVDQGPDGEWAATELTRDDLAAPHLMPVEVANILRRAVRAGTLSADVASIAHQDLTRLRVALHPYEPHADRVWALRDNLTAYDAWYIAVAETLDAPIITLDARVARSSGPKCHFRLPPAAPGGQ